MDFTPTYCGKFEAGGGLLYITDCTIGGEQQMLFFQHTSGLLDSALQRPLGRKSVLSSSVSASLLSTNSGGGDFFAYANSGGFIDASLSFSAGGGFRVEEGRVSAFSFSVNAGSNVTGTVQIFAGSLKAVSGGKQPAEDATLTMWDQCDIGYSDDIASFSLSISNDIIPIYVSGKLEPHFISVGAQTVTGVVGSYTDSPDTEAGSLQTIRFSCGNFRGQVTAVMSAGSLAASFPIPIYNHVFVGRDKQLG